jgi:adenosylmethionine-8-amino-7-oxononanoate aminotransferase
MFDKKHLMDHVHTLEPQLAAGLAPLRGLPYVGDVRQCGLIAAVELVHDVSTRRGFPSHWRVGGEVCRRMRDHGVLLRPLADVLVIMPPLAIRAENLRDLLRVVALSLTWVPEIVAAHELSESAEPSHKPEES